MDIVKGKKYNLMLTVTEQCNLNCIYCYEKEKDAKVMSIQTAKKYITEFFNLLDSSNALLISFHGGEPLKVFNLIKEICIWVWDNKWPCEYKIFAATNGTLLDDAMKEWFKNNKRRIILGLSYDGTDEMQDINRTKSSSLVDKKFFMKIGLNSQ